MKLRSIAAVGAASAVLVSSMITSAAAADPTDVVVTGASSLGLTTVTAGNFTGITLDGSVKTTYAALDNFDATDARGTGAGWNVTVQGTQFAEHNGTAYVASGKTLPLNSMLLAVPTVAKKDSTSSALPTVSIGSSTAVDASSAVKIASAAADGTGMGSYTFTQGDLDTGTAGTQPLKLTVPASAYAKTYRSDVTVSIVSGP
ncbi:MAG: WxL domain-containing protein [Actinomycetota bacterium]|nr:WxL domain-containing protein [Actinomycetota bacterium]